MADEKTTPDTAAEEQHEESGFTHQISAQQYLDGLKAEYKAATTKAHRDAVKAEIDALLGVKE